ncbi:DUF6677 family protein [Haloarchaeobius sp. DFWS5]|uniref:DUF6677 family protein n=1 Tax=Haloarchaeobius sp. DFWS5 TaxID=3446114 RepID=UPI003EBC6722
MVRVRVIVAVVLSFLFPGSGHLYLRRWVRALFFLGFTVTVATLAVPQMATESVGSVDAVLQAAESTMEQVSTGESIALTIVQVAAMTDAYFVGTTAARSDEGGPRCPSCGRELDRDINFCPWCAHELNDLRR